MLKGIDPLLSPDLLRLLAEVGHDDALVLADANFIAMRPGARTPVLRLPGGAPAPGGRARRAGPGGARCGRSQARRVGPKTYGARWPSCSAAPPSRRTA